MWDQLPALRRAAHHHGKAESGVVRQRLGRYLPEVQLTDDQKCFLPKGRSLVPLAGDGKMPVPQRLFLRQLTQGLFPVPAEFMGARSDHGQIRSQQVLQCLVILFLQIYVPNETAKLLRFHK